MRTTLPNPRTTRAAMLVLRALIEPLERRSLLAGIAPLDTVIFGNTTSETNHGFATNSSQVIAGGVGQAARQLLPLTPLNVNGGDMTFNVAVDPVNRNYFSIKLWGSDDTDVGKGRLYLYVPIGGVNYQVGYRHEGDYAPLSVTASSQPLPGRFFYSSTLLPLSMTKGKTTLTVKIISTGELYALGGGGGPPDGNYQHYMDTPSRGVYRAYTHTQPMLDVSGETQGASPTVTTRPALTESSVLGSSGTYTTGLKNWVTGRLNAAITSFDTSDVELLAKSYTVSQITTGYQVAAVLTKVIAVIDGFTADWYTNPANVDSSSAYGANGGNEVWGGRFGPLGWAIHLLSGVPAFTSQLDTVVNYGTVGGNKTRRAAWGDMLQASRDSGRFIRNARYITNQTIYANISIYKANRAMIDLGDADAFTDTAAQRYLKESIGISPWLGSDLPGGGSALKYGSNYLQVTKKGLTREWGYAGVYSEMAVNAANFYRWTGNVEFKTQAVKMLKAIANMRRPSMEVSGGNYYRTSERIGILAWRGARESDGDFADGVAYGGAASWSAGMIVAGVTLDPYAIGYAKQMLADNQYLNALISDGRYYSSLSFDSLNAMEPYADYYAVQAAADTGIRLPMTSGQPDYAWADEENGLAAIKQGENRLWIEPYWQAKSGTGINGVGRFYYSTPTYEQFGTFETNPNFTSDGSYFLRRDFVDNPGGSGYVPPDAPTQAYKDEALPIAVAPNDSGDDTPYRGKVDFYGFRFGNYVFGMNVSETKTFNVKTPAGFTSATDLISNTIKSGSVSVGPGSTVILNLAASADAAPVPTAPLLVKAAGSATQVVLNWSAASGAISYNVKRSQTPDGPYTTIGTGIIGTTFTDTGVTRAAGYYYVVSAVNGNGESYDSGVANSSAGLANAWSSQDIGTVALPGSSSISGTTFTVRGTGGDVGGTSDSFHFAYTTLNGNGSIVARVANAMYTRGDDKVGLAIRETLAGNSKAASLQMYDDDRSANFNYRASDGGATSNAGTASLIGAPYWLRITRSGNTFSADVSPDGIAWTPAGSTTITMASTAYVGLFVCSRYTQQINASRFDNVSVSSLDTAPPAVTSINRTGASPTALNTVQFAVNFSEPVTGVDIGDFALATSGITGASIAGISGSGASYVVTINTGDGTGVGTIGLNLVDDDSIKDSAGQRLGGSDAVNGSFVGQTYSMVASVYNGTAGDDTYHVRMTGALVEILLNGLSTATLTKSLFPSLTFNGLAGNDTLMIDHSMGDPTPAGGIAFNGGANTAAAGDVLDVRGAGSADGFSINTAGTITHGASSSTYTAAET
ncbi:MAG: hypothetical protein H7144_16355, partial [Burkholderiales bacterium]|nr:hypothetical protein [Phycisphaerae bacterium]